MPPGDPKARRHVCPRRRDCRLSCGTEDWESCAVDLDLVGAQKERNDKDEVATTTVQLSHWEAVLPKRLLLTGRLAQAATVALGR